MSYASAIQRSRNARQTTPATSLGPYGDNVARARTIQSSILGPVDSNFHSRKPTVRGFGANAAAVREAPSGMSPLGAYVRSNTFGVYALPPPLTSDDTTYDVRKTYQGTPKVVLREDKKVDLLTQTESEGGEFVLPTPDAKVDVAHGEDVLIRKAT